MIRLLQSHITDAQVKAILDVIVRQYQKYLRLTNSKDYNDIKQLPKLLEELDKNVPEQAFSCVGCPLIGTLGVKEWEQGD